MRKVKDIVLKTIQNYRVHPEETAAEESWDYVQFQVREAASLQLWDSDVAQLSAWKIPPQRDPGPQLKGSNVTLPT